MDAAAEALSGLLSRLLGKLGKLLKEKNKREESSFSDEDVKFLKKELRSMHAAVSMVGGLPGHRDIQLKQWAGKLRELCYYTEDVLDTLLVRVDEGDEKRQIQAANWVGSSTPYWVQQHWQEKEEEGVVVEDKSPNHPAPASTAGHKSPVDRESSKGKGTIKKVVSIAVKEDKACHQIAQAIGRIKVSVQEIAQERARLMVDTAAGVPVIRTVEPRPGPSPRRRHNEVLVGVNDTRDELIRYLTEGDDTPAKKLKTVAILGFGGLGKTTLANLVYQELVSQFDCGAFVYVSMNPDMMEVLKSMLRQLNNTMSEDNSELESWDIRELTDELRRFLEKRRYFIVVDDVWNTEALKLIKVATVENYLGSRVIITTRSYDIARIDDASVYMIKPLGAKDSKRLFYIKAFGGEVDCPDNQWSDQVSEEILKACHGVPLFIISIADLLASTVKEDWYEVCKYLRYDDNLTVAHGRSILAVSYCCLPSHLRACLLHISAFPECSEVRRDRVVWSWIAEGLVQEKQGCSLFKLGQSYFEELLSRSLIQEVGNDDGDGMAKYYRVHDMVLYHICFLANEENFVTILADGWVPASSPRRKVRRLSLQKSSGWGTRLAVSMPQVRSVTAFGTGIELMPPLSSFQVLRVLDLEGCNLRERDCDLKRLGELLHLRYIGLRGTRVAELPKEIGNLRFLQVLDLKGTYIEELPQSVALLRRLLCLHVECSTTLPDHGMGNLSSLEQLSDISICKSPNFVKELGSLTELRGLEITLEEGVDVRMKKDLVESLNKLQRMETLVIYGFQSTELDFIGEGWVLPPGLWKFVAVGWFSVLPTWIINAENLSELHIKVRQLWREDLQTLGRMQELCSLRLAVERAVERLAVDTDAFPRLRDLRLRCGTCLVFRQGSMPELRTLDFVLHPDRANDEFHWGLGNLTSLLQITARIRCANDAAAAKAKGALKEAVYAHPNRPTLEIIVLPSDQEEEQQTQPEDGTENISSNAGPSEIQEHSA
ncbi:hypothetical protein ACP70R_007982 [Stipagrostis hirtigluma subsp. patula]